jgi:Fe-S-cluster containining protein
MTARRPPDYSDAAGIFFQDGYRLARQFISGGISRASLSGLMASAFESLDSLIDSFRNRCEREGLRVDCHKGCCLCCTQAVLASGHEVLAIREYLGDQFDPSALEGIRLRTAEKHSRTREMTAMEFLHYIHPCPFLAEGCCLIYPVRPVACRCYLSSSLESCREQHDHPRDRTMIAALYEFPLRAGRGMNEGIRSALMEAGLIPGEWLLEAFMEEVFEDGHILDAWLAGGTPFRIRTLTAEENQYLRKYYNTPGG